MSGPDGEALSIVVVDDHDVVHWGFKLLLSRQPWVASCSSATSSEEALGLLRESDVDVALVDLFLGEESGQTFARKSGASPHRLPSY